MDEKHGICQTCLSKDRILCPLIEFRETIHNMNLYQIGNLSGSVCWECRNVLTRFMKFKLQVYEAQQILGNTTQIQHLKSLSRLETKLLINCDYQPKYDPLTVSEDILIKKEELPIDSIDSSHMYSSNSDDDEVQNDQSKNKITDTMNEGIIKNVCSVRFTEKSSIKANIKRKRRKRKILVSDNRNNNINDTQTENNIIEKTDLDILKQEIRNIDEGEMIVSSNDISIDNRVEATDSDESDGNVIDKFSTVVFTEEELLKNREEKRMQPNFKKIQYKCDMCVLGFLKKENYDVHMKKKHDESIGEHQCDICKVRYTSKLDVIRHRSQHYMCYRCKLCKYETGQIWAVVNHCRSKHRHDSKDRIHCKQCELIARTPEELAEHIKTKHTLKCDECGGRFKGKNTLRTHKIRVHAVKREFICDVCTKTFTKKSRLESHMVTHDTALAKQLSYCTTCNVQYKNIYIYRGHLRNSTNHSERNYACVECDKKFSSRAYWIQHYNFYHLQKSQFICEQCDKIFISDWRLRNHKQKYHGLDRPRDHQCNECGKKFFTLAILRGHQLTHSEQRTFMCSDCGDTFKQRPALYTHTRLVHQKMKRKK
ncbi:zinc finger protein 585A-like [Achroia grisella]|uniref:zinc finger protein 585A-like n=1 Tax=Achroia grisella TaxID=688607 RepID=UPI0027D2D1DA|nr:zinc finger protein 585A-like [Achroia grisella]